MHKSVKTSFPCRSRGHALPSILEVSPGTKRTVRPSDSFRCESMSRYVNKHHKSLAKDRPQSDRNVARLFVQNVLLVLLHGHSRRHAILSVFILLRASRHERLLQVNGRPQHHSGLYPNISKAVEPLAQSSVRLVTINRRDFWDIIRDE